MNTTAIRQAIKLYKHPLEMSGLTNVNGKLPTGITDLLRLCASEKKLEEFAVARDLNADMLYNVLTHFIEQVLFKEGSPSNKILGTDAVLSGGADTDLLRLHYKLLMNIYHPDRNRSSSSSFYASKISAAYDQLKKQAMDDSPYQEQRAYFEPSDHYFQATQSAQKQINQTRNTFFAFSSIIALSLITLVVYLNQPDSSRLIVRNSAENTAEISHVSSSIDSSIEHAKYKNASSIKVSGKSMQVLLQKLEKAYEQGNVDQITPILANAPEMRLKSNEELSSKLKTLFQITKQRKMVLYNFSWKNIAGQIKGEGHFLSRYLLAGEDEWKTRTGLASISAKIEDDQIHITTLDMSDETIQQ